MERLSLPPLSSILVISRWRKDIDKRQCERDQVYSVKNSAASGIQTHTAIKVKKKRFTLKLKQCDDFFHNYDHVNWCGSRQKDGGG